MKKLIWGFGLLGTLMMWACQPNNLYPGESDRCRGGRCYYAFEDGKDLSIRIDTIDPENNTALYIQVENGAKRMFSYTYVKNDRENIADDEYTEFLRFLVDPSLDEFSLNFPEDQASSKAYLQPSCFCLPATYAIETGTITGKKVNANRWDLSVDIGYKGYDNELETLSFSSDFEKVDE